MAEYQVNMTESGDAAIIDLDHPGAEIIIARSEIPYVARDLLAIMGFGHAYRLVELRDGTGFSRGARFVQVSA